LAIKGSLHDEQVAEKSDKGRVTSDKSVF